MLFPAGKAGNVFRGAFGTVFRRIACMPACADARSCAQRAACPYARMFEPVLAAGPSGLADPPRPFVFRAAHLDGKLIAPGEQFSVDVHVFDLKEPALAYFALTFAQLAREGLGSRRTKVQLESVTGIDLNGGTAATLFEGAEFTLRTPPEPLSLSLDAPADKITRVIVRFVTPTELKPEEAVARPDFGVLFARVRDRISTLAALYGDGPLELDFRGMSQRAQQVRLIRAELERADVLRRSSRTGEVHGVGGVVGEIEYEGELSEFVPFLRAGYWTGVGRHTVWGNGVIVIAG